MASANSVDGQGLQIIVMGVSACGKNTVGRSLATRLGAVFLDADDLHPQSNVAKMTAGIALTDQDRQPWLEAVAARLASAAGGASGLVVACSALRQRYRDVLRGGTSTVRFVHLVIAPELAEERIRTRTGHFMAPSLLDSQFATLEPLAAHEGGIEVEADVPPDLITNCVLHRLDQPCRVAAGPDLRDRGADRL